METFLRQITHIFWYYAGSKNILLKTNIYKNFVFNLIELLMSIIYILKICYCFNFILDKTNDTYSMLSNSSSRIKMRRLIILDVGEIKIEQSSIRVSACCDKTHGYTSAGNVMASMLYNCLFNSCVNIIGFLFCSLE